MADRVAVMRDGRIVQVDTPRRDLRSARQPRRRRLRRPRQSVAATSPGRARRHAARRARARCRTARGGAARCRAGPAGAPERAPRPGRRRRTASPAPSRATGSSAPRAASISPPRAARCRGETARAATSPQVHIPPETVQLLAPTDPRREMTTMSCSLLAAALAALALRASPRRRSVADFARALSRREGALRGGQKEGMVVSFDTGPTWANWAAQFSAFKKRYPDVEMTYNDLGSGATVIALEKARNRPQADTAYYFAASAVDAVAKDVVAPFKPVNFDKLPEVFRHPEGKWFTIHSLTIAFVVNTKLVKHVPQSWADLLEAGIQGHGRLSRSALDRRRPGADLRGRLRQWRRRGQRAAGHRLSRQAARPAMCCAWSEPRPMRSSSRARSRSGSPTRTTASRPSTSTAWATRWRW